MELEKRSVGQLHADVISSEKSLGQFSDLLDSCFLVPNGMRYFDDFPVWSDRHGVYPLLRIGVFHKEALVSSAAVRIASLKSHGQGSLVSVALIGAVATDPKWRGMGLASRIVSIALQWAIERGASLALLWSSQHQLYQKLGFEFSGQQLKVPLGATNAISESALSVYEGWSPHLFKLIQKRPLGLILTDKDRGWFEAHKNVKWVYAGTQNEPRAYVAIGRGIDLKGVIHEWGGDPEALSTLFAYLRERDPQLTLLCSPSFLPEGIISDFSQTTIEPLCMAKILDPIRLISGLFPALVNEGSIQIGINGGLSTLSIRDQISTALSRQDLAKLILGSTSSEEKFKDKKRSGLFPVPFWIWGLDAA